ncbi:MAG TPA: BMP family ABC transporter substrate-binding protein [Firmicutes bacterium]|nr:BMP family ABC transporter substrate-binding protein [Bacillota bacterium]
MKKLLALGLAATVAVAGLGAFAGCSGDGAGDSIKVGFIALHDDNSTYDKNFLDAIRQACKNKNIPDENLVIRTGIPEEQDCYDAAADLADQGCDVVFADSFGHEPFIMQAAQEFPEVQFCHATGTYAHTAGIANHHNAFASIYEGRYLAGVAAGMKLVEMYNNGLQEKNFDAEGNIKIGYVGAYPYAEVVSGYTSFFLGAQSVVEEELADEGISVSMEVTYTGSWFDEQKEKDGANTLIGNGAALISQHADSMGAPSACEDAGVPNVSYNGSTAAECPDTYIISSRINWVPYFEYMIDCVMNGDEIDKDWTGTLENGAVALTEVGAAAAEGTQAKIDEVKAKLISGELKVFDCSKFTVGGEHLTEYMADVDTDKNYEKDTQVIENGVFMESKYRSAPYFDVRIDGITELSSAE